MIFMVGVILAVSTIGSQGFSFAAPSVWNKLPLEIHNSSLFATFKRNLKDIIFSVPYCRPTFLLLAHTSDLALQLTEMCVTNRFI